VVGADGGAVFNATTTDRPLWANAKGHPSIWIRWTAAHEEYVVAEQRLTFGPSGQSECIGRAVTTDPHGEWFVSDWRPLCGTCSGTRVVEIGPATRESGHPERQGWIDALVSSMDAALYYMLVNLVECPDCRAHPGWVVG
jgi:hypothetical protein